MRVLLDENLPRRLKRIFREGVEVKTVDECGWKGLKNGVLLNLAQTGFNVFITTDKAIPDEQNLSLLSLAVIILEAKSNRFEDLFLLLTEINEVLLSIKVGELVRINSKKF